MAAARTRTTTTRRPQPAARRQVFEFVSGDTVVRTTTSRRRPATRRTSARRVPTAYRSGHLYIAGLHWLVPTLAILLVVACLIPR